ncbi:MAG: hypothetical protein FWC92_02665 [Defluviitaleaceae bacterium]|nr:hypothetical protein [Defluviitaleaceae bacterium]
MQKYIITASTAMRSKTNGGVVYMFPVIIMKIVYLVPLMFIWRTITASGAAIEMSLSQLLTYTYVNALLADMLIIQTYMTGWDFDSKSTAMFTRPMSVYGQVISRTVGEWGPTLLLFSLPMAVIAPFLGIQIIPYTLWFIPSLILCISLGFALEFVFFCITLRLRNVSWLMHVIRAAIISFFSGTVIPFRILPFGLDRWMAYQPFGSLGGAPLALYVGVNQPVRVITAQVVWNVVFWLIAICWFKQSRERMVSFGG